MPSGIPSGTEVSRTDSPPSTIACSTSRSCGAGEPSASPTSPDNVDANKVSSAVGASTSTVPVAASTRFWCLLSARNASTSRRAATVHSDPSALPPAALPTNEPAARHTVP